MTERKRRKQDSSWRSIEQAGFRPSASKEGSRRQHKRLKQLGFIVGVYLLILGISISLYFYYLTESEKQNILAEGNKVELRIETNGFLKKDFLVDYLEGSLSQKLIDIDIITVKKKLENLSQIQQVTVERIFPSILSLSVNEYQPFAKIGILEEGKRRIFYVSEEGVLFNIIQTSEAPIQHLPFLGGVNVSRGKQGRLHVDGMDLIAPLLENARRNKPHLYNEWKIVSVGTPTFINNHKYPTLNVQTSNLGMVTFSTNNIAGQMDKLDYIFRDVVSRDLGIVKDIDLSLGEHATVQMAYSKLNKTL